MLSFLKGKVIKLNNNKPNGIQFLNGHAHPILGNFVSKFQSVWKIYFG
jgi:hypothetical protein